MPRSREPDMRVVDAMCRGVTPSRPPSAAERLAAIRHLAGRMPDSQIAARVGRSTRTVVRLRTAHGIAGLRRGSNRHSQLRGKNLP